MVEKSGKSVREHLEAAVRQRGGADAAGRAPEATKAPVDKAEDNPQGELPLDANASPEAANETPVPEAFYSLGDMIDAEPDQTRREKMSLLYARSYQAYEHEWKEAERLSALAKQKIAALDELESRHHVVQSHNDRMRRFIELADTGRRFADYQEGEDRRHKERTQMHKERMAGVERLLRPRKVIRDENGRILSMQVDDGEQFGNA
jgi:hypothetical protein